MKKKIFVGIAMLIFCMSFSISAFALTEGDWEFKLLNDEVTITGYLGKGGDVVIPTHIYNVPVTKVTGSQIFKSVTSITFPPTVKVIESNLFGFDYQYNTVLTTVILPEGVEKICKDAFPNCVKLKNITLPSTITDIEGGYYSGAFQGCTALKSINFPENLKSIGGYAFAGSGLETVDLSAAKKLTELEYSCFSGCNNLNTVILNTGLKVIGSHAFYICTGLKNVSFSDTVEEISFWGFEGCTSLETLILPTSLKKIGGFAFCNCTSLVEVIIPYGTTSIDEGAFQSCKSLLSLYVPDTVVNVKDFSMHDANDAIVYCSENSKMAARCKKSNISYLTDDSVNSGITVIYNGRRVSFHANGQNPEIVGGRTLVPLRAIFEAMKADVEWNQETKTVTATRDGIEISISIGANVMYKDNEEIAVDVPAQLINDRTMVPVRVIAEAFGADVEWNNNGRAVIITE